MDFHLNALEQEIAANNTKNVRKLIQEIKDAPHTLTGTQFNRFMDLLDRAEA